MHDPEEGKGTKNIDILSLSQLVLLHLFSHSVQIITNFVSKATLVSFENSFLSKNCSLIGFM